MADKYPYGSGDRLRAVDFDRAFELSAGTVPPSGSVGGAGQFKMWMDTSVSPPMLRVATAARATAGVYNATEWASMGSLNLSTRRFTFIGDWSGDISANNLNVSGNATISQVLSVNGGRMYLQSGSPVGAGDTGITFTNSLHSWAIQDQGSSSGAGELWFYDLTNSRLVLTLRTDGSAAFIGNVTANGNLFLGGNTIEFQGAALSTAPFLRFTSTDVVLRCGSSYGTMYFQNNAGTIGFQVSSDGLVKTFGAGSGINVTARDNVDQVWGFYGQGGQGYIWNSSVGPLVTFDYGGTNASFRNNITVAGAISVVGGVNCSGVNSTGGGHFALNLGTDQLLSAGNGCQIANSLSVSSGGLSVNGTVTLNGPTSVNNALAVTGIATMGNGLTVNNNQLVVNNVCVVNGRLNVQDIVNSGLLRGGPGDAGCLKSATSGSMIYFTWDGADLSYAIDNNLHWELCTQTNARDLGMVNVGAGPTGWHLQVNDHSGNNFALYADVVSDARLKERIVDSEIDALGLLRSVAVRQFDFTSEYTAWCGGEARPYHVDIGMVAQEIRALIPEAVRVETRSPPEGSPVPEGAHSIRYDSFVPYLVKAMQQLADRVQSLEGR